MMMMKTAAILAALLAATDAASSWQQDRLNIPSTRQMQSFPPPEDSTTNAAATTSAPFAQTTQAPNNQVPANSQPPPPQTTVTQAPQQQATQKPVATTTQAPQQPAYQPYPLGIDVWWQFDEVWYEGTIIAWDERTKSYVVSWEDGEVADYTDLQQVDQMVANAYSDDNPYIVPADYVPYSVNTPVLLEFASGWYEGNIVSYHYVNSTYAFYDIEWSDGAQGEYEYDEVDDMVEAAAEYEPWPIGTKVYNEVADEDVAATMAGSVFAFARGTYTIKWQDGTTTTYYDFDDVDTLVGAAIRANGGSIADAANNVASYEPWEVDTVVWYEFEDGWWQGTITEYDPLEQAYDITWEDGTVSTYYDLDKVDEMVYNGQEEEADDTLLDDEIIQDYELGTLVYRKFEDGWWVGNIVAFDDGFYAVRWVDNSFDYYEVGSEDLDQIVEDGQYVPDDADISVYAIGTPVYREFESGWYYGTITSYYRTMYTVEWEDDTTTYHVQGPEMDAMVAAGVPPDHMSGAGRAVLSIFILGVAATLISYGMKRHTNAQRAMIDEASVSAEEVEELERKHEVIVT